MVSPHPLSPALSISVAMKTPEHTEEESDDLEQADGDIQNEYSSDSLYSPDIGAVTKITCKNLCQ